MEIDLEMARECSRLRYMATVENFSEHPYILGMRQSTAELAISTIKAMALYIFEACYCTIDGMYIYPSSEHAKPIIKKIESGIAEDAARVNLDKIAERIGGGNHIM